jgi:ribosomal protein L37AE/L43A
MTCDAAKPLESASPASVCPACEAAKLKRSGLYHLSCLDCCARLVASAYPNRRAASAMMTVVKRHIARCAPTFGPADVTESVRQLLEKRRSVTPRSSTD